MWKDFLKNHSAELTVMTIGLVISVGITLALGTGDAFAGRGRH
jgi:ATP-dependent protease ClpP protease subunit